MHSAHLPPGAAPSYAEAVRRHPRVVLSIVAVAVLVGVLWLAVRSPVYQASAEILVAPVSPDDRALVGLAVVRDAAGDPTRTIQTAASLLESPSSAEAAASILAGPWTRRAAQEAVRVEPLGQTSLVAVTARGSSPREAIRVANAYAAGALRMRDRIVGAQIRQRVADLTDRLAAVPPDSPAASDLTERRDDLAALRGDDPSLSLAQPAVPPARTTGTPGWLILGVILAIGLAAGAATAAALDAVERRGAFPRPGAAEPGSPPVSNPVPPHATSATSDTEPGTDSAPIRPSPRAALDAEPDAAPASPVAPPADEAQFVALVARAMGDAGPKLTRDQFNAWARTQPVGNGTSALPSAAVIARRFGGWAAAKERARATLGAETDRVRAPGPRPAREGGAKPSELHPDSTR
jgi:capsular polysaccharide biosynthesis protein